MKIFIAKTKARMDYRNIFSLSASLSTKKECDRTSWMAHSLEYNFRKRKDKNDSIHKGSSNAPDKH